MLVSGVLCLDFGSCRSGLALGGGLFPICQEGVKQLFGVGCGLIQSVLETPKAPTHPVASINIIVIPADATQELVL